MTVYWIVLGAAVVVSYGLGHAAGVTRANQRHARSERAREAHERKRIADRAEKAAATRKAKADEAKSHIDSAQVKKGRRR